MPTKQKSQQSVKSTNRGDQPGDTKIKRAKRTGTGVAHIKEGNTLVDGIREDRFKARADTYNRPATARPTFRGNAQVMQRKQADLAYAAIHPERGTFEAKVTAMFTKAWLDAITTRVNGVLVKSRTAIAKETVLSQLPADQAKSKQVGNILQHAADAFRTAGDQLYS